MKCTVCGINNAIKNEMFGYLPCSSCQERQSKGSRPNPIEFVSESIKEERIKFKKDIYQPFRGNEVSKEYLEAHGTKGIKISKEEAKKAKPTWPELNYYKS